MDNYEKLDYIYRNNLFWQYQHIVNLIRLENSINIEIILEYEYVSNYIETLASNYITNIKRLISTYMYQVKYSIRFTPIILFNDVISLQIICLVLLSALLTSLCVYNKGILKANYNALKRLYLYELFLILIISFISLITILSSDINLWISLDQFSSMLLYELSQETSINTIEITKSVPVEISNNTIIYDNDVVENYYNDYHNIGILPYHMLKDILLVLGWTLAYSYFTGYINWVNQQDRIRESVDSLNDITNKLENSLNKAKESEKLLNSNRSQSLLGDNFIDNFNVINPVEYIIMLLITYIIKRLLLIILVYLFTKLFSIRSTTFFNWINTDGDKEPKKDSKEGNNELANKDEDKKAEETSKENVNKTVKSVKSARKHPRKRNELWSYIGHNKVTGDTYYLVDEIILTLCWKYLVCI